MPNTEDMPVGPYVCIVKSEVQTGPNNEKYVFIRCLSDFGKYHFEKDATVDVANSNINLDGVPPEKGMCVICFKPRSNKRGQLRFFHMRRIMEDDPWFEDVEVYLRETSTQKTEGGEEEKKRVYASNYIQNLNESGIASSLINIL